MKWVQLYGSLNILWYSFSLGLEWKLTFSSSEAIAEFSNFAGIEFNTLTSSSFRIWNSSAGNPSPPLALFVVIFPKPHLTSHSRISGSRWVTAPVRLSRSLRPFMYSSPAYSFLFFLISSPSVKSLQFLSFIVLLFAWNIPFVSLVLLKRFLVFHILLFSSSSLHCSLKKVF